MREMRAAGTFAHCPNPRCGSLEPFIHPDIATVVHFDTGLLQPETLRVRDPSGSHEKIGALQRTLALRSAYTHPDPLTGRALDFKDCGIKRPLDTFILEQAKNRFSNIGILSGDELSPTFQYRDSASEPPYR